MSRPYPHRSPLRRTTGLATLACLLLPALALAHEVRPGYLEMRETEQGVFDVLWKRPARGELQLSLAPEISGPADRLGEGLVRHTDTAVVETWRLRMQGPLAGRTVRIRGLEGTMTDALVRVEHADGTSWTQRLTPSAPAAVVPERQSAWALAAAYAGLGVEHILAGIDHLLFVLALLLATKGTARLVKTITAFTVAHSITLGLATLGLASAPQQPVEAVIALSIVLVAAEMVRSHRSGGRLWSLTVRAPWIVAFGFGLLHGFGFAGALGEIGLPQGHIPLALLCFNAGVELGQLLFVAVVLALASVARRVRPALLARAHPLRLLPAYAIGSVAMFWVIQRIAAF